MLSLLFILAGPAAAGPAAAGTAAAAAPDLGPWQAVLTASVGQDGRVDYAAAEASGALEGFVAGLAAAAEPVDPDARLAFWLNAYNALTVDLVADHWPLASIRDLDGGKVWDTRRFTVAGASLTLNQIEHERIRPLGDGRIHAAVNCASLGCPPLAREAYTGPALQVQLDAAAARWVSTNAVQIDRASGAARFNQIFQWYASDFAGQASPPGQGGDLGQAAAWVARFAAPSDAAWLRAGAYQATWADYDWGVNGR